MHIAQDNSGTITRDEFIALPQVSSNPLATRMIAIFDEDGGGDVDFQEFVSGLSAFSSKGNKEEKLKFAFKVYDIDRDGFISNGELFIVLKMMVGSNLKDQQLQQIVDKTIMEADANKDGKISFEEFTKMVENTDVSMSMTLGKLTKALSGNDLLKQRRPNLNNTLEQRMVQIVIDVQFCVIKDAHLLFSKFGALAISPLLFMKSVPKFSTLSLPNKPGTHSRYLLTAH